MLQGKVGIPHPVARTEAERHGSRVNMSNLGVESARDVRGSNDYSQEPYERQSWTLDMLAPTTEHQVTGGDGRRETRDYGE